MPRFWLCPLTSPIPGTWYVRDRQQSKAPPNNDRHDGLESTCSVNPGVERCAKLAHAVEIAPSTDNERELVRHLHWRVW